MLDVICGWKCYREISTFEINQSKLIKSDNCEIDPNYQSKIIEGLRLDDPDGDTTAFFFAYKTQQFIPKFDLFFGKISINRKS